LLSLNAESHNIVLISSPRVVFFSTRPHGINVRSQFSDLLPFATHGASIVAFSRFSSHFFLKYRLCAEPPSFCFHAHYSPHPDLRTGFRPLSSDSSTPSPPPSLSFLSPRLSFPKRRHSWHPIRLVPVASAVSFSVKRPEGYGGELAN